MATQSSNAAAVKTEILFIQTSECVGEFMPAAARCPPTPRVGVAKRRHGRGRWVLVRKDIPRTRLVFEWARGTAEVYLRQTSGLAVFTPAVECRIKRGDGTRHGP